MCNKRWLRAAIHWGQFVAGMLSSCTCAVQRPGLLSALGCVSFFPSVHCWRFLVPEVKNLRIHLFYIWLYCVENYEHCSEVGCRSTDCLTLLAAAGLQTQLLQNTRRKKNFLFSWHNIFFTFREILHQRVFLCVSGSSGLSAALTKRRRAALPVFSWLVTALPSVCSLPVCVCAASWQRSLHPSHAPRNQHSSKATGNEFAELISENKCYSVNTKL